MVARRLFLYKKDATGTPPDPATASVSVSFALPESQVGMSVSALITPPAGRGTVIETFGGITVQDISPMSTYAGGKIVIEDGPQLTTAERDIIKTLYETANGRFYFTDKVEYFEVAFSRNPRGFRYWLNYPLYEFGFTRYSFALDLIIINKVL